MRRTTSILPALLLATAGLLAGPATADVAAAPLDFAATALDGSAVSGQSLAGRWVLLDFWGTWCAPCVAAFPKLERLQREHADRLAVVGLAFQSGTAEEVAAFLAEHGVRDYTAWLGEEALLDKFGILAFPSYMLIGPDRELVFEQIGELPDIYERVSEELAQAPALSTQR